MNWRQLVGLSTLALLALAFGLGLGSVHLSADALWQALWHQGDPLTQTLVWQLRVPRTLMAFGVGGALALAGWQMQILLGNPLAEPYLLGISGGASLAGVGGLLLGLSSVALGLWVGMGAAASFFVVAILAGGQIGERLLLTGVMLNSLTLAVITLILFLAPGESLRGIMFWIAGDLSQSTVFWPVWLLTLLLGAFSLYLAPSLAVLAQGEVFAESLGVPVVRLRRYLWLSASALTAATVIAVGAIGFVGLTIPHLARRLLGHQPRDQILGSVLLGGSLLCFADTLARTVLAPRQLPVGVITALIGVPWFLWMLRRDRTFNAN